MSTSAVGRGLTSGRFRHLYRGVYLVGPVEPDRALEMGAVLFGGPSAVLSHTSALRLWEMSQIDPPRPVHVTVPGSGRRRRPAVVFHRVEALAEDERGNLDGIPITTPARTIADVAGMLASRELEQAVAVGEREGLVTSKELAQLTERYPRRPGMPLLRAILRERNECHFTRSEAERRCLQLLRNAELPRPHTNVTVGPYELDLFWPEAGVAIEIDGWEHHSRRARFEADRRKDNWLRARGIDVIRLSWRQITHQATASAVQVGQALALAQARR
jgi:very-short-patch-repair endonuclease